ncbi:MAG: hypothetical protein K8S16_10765 [Bacteroidales bacterium]|nr:hypothetical protein [Bacteroidales bacterium]
MSGFLKFILFLFIALVIALSGYYAYFYYKSLKDPHFPAIHAISPESVLFAEIMDFEQSVYKFTSHSQIWKAMLDEGICNDLNDEIHYIDSLFSTHSVIREIVAVHKFIISFNLTEGNTIKPLFIVELPQGSGSSDIEAFIKEKNGDKCILMKKEFEGISYNLVNIAGVEKIFYCTVHYGLFIGSFIEAHVTDAIYQLDHGRSMVTDPNFTKIASTAGKNVDANLYINFRNLGKTLGPVVSNKVRFQALGLNSFATFSETDLIINPDEVLLNGYTITADSMGFDLDAFRQPPQQITIPEILPFDISWMAHIGIEDFTQFINLTSVNKKPGFDQYLESLKNKFDIDLMKEFVPWIGHEYALTEYVNEPIAIVHSGDILKAGVRLEVINNKVNRKLGAGKTLSRHEGYLVKKLNIPELLGNLFGEMFKSVSGNYYVTLKDFVIFANRPEPLTKVIDAFYTRKTLANDLNYQSFSNNISDKSNIFLYAAFRKPGNLFENLLADDVNKKVKQHTELIHNFEGFALQLSYINRMFYTNIYLKYNPGYQQFIPSSWEFELDAPVAGKPQLIKNHRTGKLNIVAFDSLNKMYLADHMGAIQWKLPLKEAPVSGVKLVDYYDNGKFQYLFNTENYIYMVDLKGNYVADYPVKLTTRSTNPMEVFDYNKNNQSRMLIALQDNKVYNFTKNFEETKGWNKIQASAGINAPVQHLVAGSKDYIFVTDENGNVLITDRKGQSRIDLKKKFTKAKYSDFYVNNTNSKGLFITTDDRGQLVYINAKGTVKRTSFGDYSEGHFFLYTDFDGNGAEDFIFTDRNKLVIFDRFKETLFEHTFTENLLYKPVVFKGKRGMKNIGVVLFQSKEIQVFSINGREFSGQHLAAETHFDIGAMSSGNSLNLVAGLGKRVINYSLEE